MSDSHERTEQPTPRRLARARAEGEWPQGALAASWLALVLAALPAYVALQATAGWIRLWRATAADAAVHADSATAQPLIDALASWFAWPGGWQVILTAALVAVAAAVGGAAAGGALGFSGAALRFRPERLSWAAGARQLINVGGALLATEALASIVLLCWSAWPALRALAEIAAAGGSAHTVAIAIGNVFRDCWWRSTLALAAVTCLHVWQVRRRATLAFRMSAREVRDERAQTEGKPEARARRRNEGLRRARSVQAREIRKATAVVVNPAHLAVALRYAPPRIDVPIVVSRGADLAALLVRTIAAVHDVPVIESPALARALFVNAAIGEPIPEECYAAVAAVFAWLLQTRGCLRGAEEQ